ncbi:MAG: beta-galactosidase [Bifidobacteriaceae bacterium]|jgi:hypothetical protein|nr:beta-galactosidase [Bifidobacteriaceae bacterium]
MAVDIAGHKLQVGSEAVPLLSGQVDYWLHPAPFWDRILTAVKDIGLPMVACYVPWNYHQLEDGRFDFTGRTDPSRNLAGFLDQAAALGLKVFLRPGPWIYDFFMDGGVPLAASQYHRLDPRFLEAARGYLEAVARVVRPRLAAAGGPVVLIQVDNEIEPLATQRGDSGGLAGPDDQVGPSYGTQLASFAVAGVGTLADATAQGPAAVMEYHRRYSTLYAQTMTDLFREVGLTGPLTLNVFMNLEPQSNADFARLVPLVGGDYWGKNHLPWDQLLLFSRHVRHLRTTTGTPYSAEFQSVTINQFVAQGTEDVITPDNTLYLGLLGMLLGLKGWNWYTIAERSSLYFAPINQFGGRVPGYFEPYQRLHRLFLDLDWPTWEPLDDLVMWFDRASFRRQMRYRQPLDQPFWAITEIAGGPWLQAFEAIHLGDCDAALFDPEAAHNPPVAGRVMVVAGGGPERGGDQARLRAMATEHGTVLVFVGAPPEGGAFPELSRATSDTGFVRLGRGRAVVVDPAAAPAGVIEALTAAGVRQKAASGRPRVLSSAWTRGPERLVVALNTTGEAAPGPFKLDLAGLGLDPEAWYRVSWCLAGVWAEVPGAELAALELPLGPYQGEVVRIGPL